MIKFSQYQDHKLVFQYDVEILTEIVDLLKSINYSKIQCIPPRHSFLAIVKEHENICNLILKKKHLLFYYSLFPKFYQIFLNKKLRSCFDLCFLNKYISKSELLNIFSKELVNKALSNNILFQKDDMFRFTLSFIPYDNYIFLREPYEVYDAFNIDPEKSGHPEYDNRVWMGADSIIFARFLEKYLNNKFYKRAIEIGSGTGILTIVSSKFAEVFEVIDYNKRAIQYTKFNIAINKIKNIEATYSNMFEKVDGKFDLMLAAPWFIDLEKGGLEEVPDIMDGLENYLNHDGLCLMTLNSYIKNGKDPVVDYLKDFAKLKNYDLDLYTIGYNIETFRLNDWKKHGVEYCAGYFAIIKKNGSGFLKRHEVSIFRKIRDFTFINLYRFFNNF